jgi:hypothetical protein
VGRLVGVENDDALQRGQSADGVPTSGASPQPPSNPPCWRSPPVTGTVRSRFGPCLHGSDGVGDFPSGDRSSFVVWPLHPHGRCSWDGGSAVTRSAGAGRCFTTQANWHGQRSGPPAVTDMNPTRTATRERIARHQSIRHDRQPCHIGLHRPVSSTSSAEEGKCESQRTHR